MARTQQAAQANITLQEQIEAIHKAKGLVPEDDTKEKIGPSKPNEIPQQPPPPSSATNIPSSAPPITSVPRPPAVSWKLSCDEVFFILVLRDWSGEWLWCMMFCVGKATVVEHGLKTSRSS